jgi:hypothetical protein
MIAATEDDIDEHVAPSVLSGINVTVIFRLGERLLNAFLTCVHCHPYSSDITHYVL